MAGEKSLWCVDCGKELWIGKNAVASFDGDVQDIVAWLLSHETTNQRTHRLVYLAGSDVDAARIQMPLTAEIIRTMNA